MMSKNLRFNFDHVLEQWLTGGKREAKREILRLEYFENEKINSKHKLLIRIQIKISKLFNETRSIC